MEKRREMMVDSLQGQELLLQLLWGAGSYVVAAGTMLEGLSPFGAALVAACPEKLLLVTAIGAAGGSLFPAGVTMSMKYAAAVLIAAVARWAFFGERWQKVSTRLVPLLAGGALLLPSLTVELTGDWSSYSLILALAESCLAAGAAYFFERTGQVIRQGLRALRRMDAACLMVSLCILLLSLSAFQPFGLSLGRIAACLCILLLAALGGESLGASGGITCGIALSLAQFPDLSSLGVYGVSGLLSSVFAPVGKLAGCAAFVLSHGLLALLTQNSSATPFLLEGAVASVVFMLLPMKRLNHWRSRCFRRLDQVESRSMKELLLSRVEDASKAMEDIAQTTREVSEQLDALKAGSIEEVYQAAVDGVCRGCGRSVRCWQKEFGDTMNSFNHFTEILRSSGSITAEDFVYPLSGNCRQKDRLVELVNSRYGAYREKEGLRRKVAQVRGVVTDQFEGMAEMLRGFGEEMLEISSWDRRLNQKLQVYLEELELEVRSVNCYRDKNDILFVQLTLPERKLPRVKGEELAEALGELCGRELEAPEIITSGNMLRLTFREAAEYAMDFAQSQHICSGSTVCGDSCRSFVDRRSVAHMVISDGMGNGQGAAVDSGLTVTLLEKLLEANVAYDPALKMVNSALLVKTGDESLATVDISAVDLYSGRVDFYKAGAAPTFVRRHGKCSYVESASLPVGILNSVDVGRSSLQLSAGDLIVMVSDGATTSGLDWIRHTIDRYQEQDGLQSLCDDIATTARLKRTDLRDDDITVVAGILQKV